MSNRTLGRLLPSPVALSALKDGEDPQPKRADGFVASRREHRITFEKEEHMSFVQLVKFRSKPGTDFAALDRKWVEQVGRAPNSGWQRSISFQNSSDPNELYEIVWFESEEKARASEKSPQHLALLEEMMASSDGEPSFVDLTLHFEAER